MGLKGGVSKTVKFSLALDALIRKHRGCRTGTNRKIRIRTEVLKERYIQRNIIAGQEDTVKRGYFPLKSFPLRFE